MRKSILAVWCALFAVALFSSQVWAEESGFKISDYIPEKFKDFEWKLGGGVNLAGSSSSTEYEYPPDVSRDYRQQEESSTEWQNTLRSFASYRYETIPQYYQIDLSLAGGFDYQSGDRGSSEIRPEYQNTWDSESENSGKTFSIDFFPRVSWGKYYWGDFLNSFELSSRVNYIERPSTEYVSWSEQVSYSDPYFTSLRKDANTEIAEDSRRFQLSFGWMPGWGRIYEGRYASTAMYMIEELRGKGALLREPMKEEMVTLCNLVYRNRLEHAVDERIRRIEVFDEILTYLNEAGITDACDNYGQLIIADVWDYFPRISRRFGFRVRGGIGVDAAYNRARTTRDAYAEDLNTRYHEDSTNIIDTLYHSQSYAYYYRESETSIFDRYVNTVVEYSNPLDRQWQLDITAEARYYLGSHEINKYLRTTYSRTTESSGGSAVASEYEADIDYRYWFGVAPALTYYRNSRTWLGLSAQYTYDRYRADEDYESTGTIRYKKYSAHTLDLMGEITYRISIPTTLSVMADYHYHQPDELGSSDSYATRDFSSYSLSVSLDHYLY